MVKNRFKKTISKVTITKIINKYDENSDVNNNSDEGRPQLFNSQETIVIIRAVRKDYRTFLMTNLTVIKRLRELNKYCLIKRFNYM